jgi:hypothetical protein
MRTPASTEAGSLFVRANRLIQFIALGCGPSEGWRRPALFGMESGQAARLFGVSDRFSVSLTTARAARIEQMLNLMT